MIIRVNETKGKNVFFDTQYGCSKGIWATGIPEIGKEYLVEFDIKEILKWDTNITKASISEYQIGIEGDTIFLIGKINLVEDNGSLIIINMGESAIMLLASGMPQKYSGYVKVVTKDIYIYDTYAI